MFDNLAVFKTEDFHDRQPQFFGLKFHVDMEYHKVAVGEGAFDIGANSGKLLFQVLKQRTKSLDPILASGVVLDETRPISGRVSSSTTPEARMGSRDFVRCFRT